MSKLKRIISLGVAVVMAVSIVACSKGTVKQEPTKTTAAASTAQVLTPEKPVKISWYWPGSADFADQGTVNEAISKYLKEKLFLNVDFTMQQFTNATYKTQVTTMQAAREPFDLFYTSGGDYFAFARQGVLLEMSDDKVNKFMPDTKKTLDEKFIKSHYVDGKLYAMPANKDNASSLGLTFNKELVTKYGFDINTVKTYEDLAPMFAILKAKEPDVTPFVAKGAVDPMVYCNFQSTAGSLEKLPGVIYMTNDAGNNKVFNQYESPELKKYLTLMNTWFKLGYIDADNDAAATTKASNGKTFVTSNKLKPGKDKEMGNAKVTWVQKELRPNDVDITDVAGSLTAISITSKYPELAMQILNLTYKDPILLNMMVFGIEGKNYTKASDGTIEVTADSTYKNTGNGWRFGNQFLNFLKKGEDADKWAQFKKFNADAKVLDPAGYSFDNSSVSNQAAALTNVSEQYWKILYTGQADPQKYLPEYIAKLKANGSDAFMAAQQKQLDAFLATKKK